MKIADIKRLFLIILIFFVVGALADKVFLFISLGLFFYIILLHRKLIHVLNWIKNRKEEFPTYLGDNPGIVENITQEVSEIRKRNRGRKKQLRTILKEFRSATTELPEAAIALKNDNTIIWANNEALIIFNIKIPGDINARVTNVIRDPQIAALLEGSRKKKSSEIRIGSPTNPERTLRVICAPYGKNRKLLIASDITRLEEAMRARTEFVANVSHELKSPLTVFKGYIETLISSEKTPKKWAFPLSEMEKQTEIMSKLVENLLFLSNLESTNLSVDSSGVRGADLIRQAHGEAIILGKEKNHMISLEIDENLVVLGSKSELYILFSNILFNAVKYTNKNGKISVKWYKANGKAFYEVADNGIGISPTHLPRITERFFKVDESRYKEESDKLGSTGLGLSLVKHVINRHNGQLKIESEAGKGSTFIASLPLKLTQTYKAK